MIKEIEIENFGPIESAAWRDLGKINLVIGNNSTGKTFLLKSLYSSIKSIEEYGRGNDPKSLEQTLSERLYWTFQGKIGDLVKRGAPNTSVVIHGNAKRSKFSFQFTTAAEKKIGKVENHFPKRDANSIFIPAKEVLSLYRIIKTSRERDKVFGFDDTYLDLVRAIEADTTMGKNYSAFAHSRVILESIIGGKVSFENGEWILKKKNNFKFTINSTSEGVKKIALFDRLLGNRYLSKQSVVFIDEPEAALHPSALMSFLEIIHSLSHTGMQFFISTHSYFVIKKLRLLSISSKQSIPVMSFCENSNVTYSNLKDDYPDNPIIQESIKLYEQEIADSLP
jgi:AAA15 family ATPase/GTPase